MGGAGPAGTASAPGLPCPGEGKPAVIRRMLILEGYNFLLVCSLMHTELVIIIIFFLNCSSGKTNPGWDMKGDLVVVAGGRLLPNPLNAGAGWVALGVGEPATLEIWGRQVRRGGASWALVTRERGECRPAGPSSLPARPAAFRLHAAHLHPAYQPVVERPPLPGSHRESPTGESPAPASRLSPDLASQVQVGPQKHRWAGWPHTPEGPLLGSWSLGGGSRPRGCSLHRQGRGGDSRRQRQRPTGSCELGGPGWSPLSRRGARFCPEAQRDPLCRHLDFRIPPPDGEGLPSFLSQVVGAHGATLGNGTAVQALAPS